jgi:hypothetical protein
MQLLLRGELPFLDVEWFLQYTESDVRAAEAAPAEDENTLLKYLSLN